MSNARTLAKFPTQVFNVDASNNVGLGATPDQKFTLGGQMSIAGLGGVALNNARGYLLHNAGASVDYGVYLRHYTGAAYDAEILLGGDASNGQNTIRFQTAATERMRIDSSGNLLVGQTGQNSSEKFGVTQSSNGMGIQVRNTNASFSSHSLFVAADRNTTNGSFNYISCYNYGSSGYRFYVLDSGNVQNINNSYGAISDAKLKENVTDTTPKLEKLNQVRVVNYNLIGEQQKQIGVIAQELEAIFPSMVEELPDRDQEGNDLGTTTKSVKYSVFVPMLIKAIQEQQAIIEQLRADVAALKGVA